MIIDSLILAAITGAGFYLIFNQLPLKARLWLLNHRLVTRIGCAIGVYGLLGGTLTALFAAGFLDLFVGILLNILGDKEAAAALNKLGAYLNELRAKLVKGITNVVGNLKLQESEAI